MQVKFSVRYTYYPTDPEERCFAAEVTFFLPKTKDGDSIPPCYRGKIGHYEVKHDSGIDMENSREIKIHFFADSLENLDKMIENAIENYRKQVIKNIEIIQKNKENREIIIDLPDPIEDRGIIAFYS